MVEKATLSQEDKKITEILNQENAVEFVLQGKWEDEEETRTGPPKRLESHYNGRDQS